MEPQTVSKAQKRKSPDQEEATIQTTSISSTTAALCITGCGFFGTNANEGMCSVCYSETKSHRVASFFPVVPPLLKKIKLSVPAIGSASSDAAAAVVDDTLSSTPADSSTRQQKQEDPTKLATATANRCVTCRKKVGLTGFRCRCSGTFCGSHRYADAHSCGFDYKAADREQIAKRNPVVLAAKIDKI